MVARRQSAIPFPGSTSSGKIPARTKDDFPTPLIAEINTKAAAVISILAALASSTSPIRRRS
jgi:hypothetical protein